MSNTGCNCGCGSTTDVSSATAVGSGACGCGCGSTTDVSSATAVGSGACSCGCGSVKSRDEEVAELTNLREAIDRRLGELAS